MPAPQAFMIKGGPVCGFECGPAIGRTDYAPGCALACHNPATILPQLNAPPNHCGFPLFRTPDVGLL
jgi:hypothetical protein